MTHTEQKAGRGYCNECGLEVHPTMLCKCPFRQQKSRAELIEEIVDKLDALLTLSGVALTHKQRMVILDEVRDSAIRISDASMDAVEVEDGLLYLECCDKCKEGDYDAIEEWHDYCSDEKCPCHATTFQRKRTLFVK